MINIFKVWRLSVKKPIRERFQKIVRRLVYGIRLTKHFRQQRRYPNISNPKARRAIYRLMMLVRMKLRVTAGMGWKEKWRMARLKVRGILKIQKVVEFERKERIEAKYAEDLPSSENRSSLNQELLDEVEGMSELGMIDEIPQVADPLSAMRKKSPVGGLTGNLRGSAMSLGKNQAPSILNTVNRASMVSLVFNQELYLPCFLFVVVPRRQVRRICQKKRCGFTHIKEINESEGHG